MSTSAFTAAELVALDPTDLAELLDAAGTPDDHLAARAAVLGLDLAIPAHLQAVMHAKDYPCGVESCPSCYILPVVDERSRSSQGGQGSLDPEPANGADPVALDIPGLIEQYRGTGQPFLAGTFALYSDVSGALVMVTDTAGRGVEQRTMPAQLVKLATNPGKFAKLLGFGR